MISYFCIVNMPGAPVKEICVIDADDDLAADKGMRALSQIWIGFETISLHYGERIVNVLSNPALGFAESPFDFLPPPLAVRLAA